MIFCLVLQQKTKGINKNYKLYVEKERIRVNIQLKMDSVVISKERGIDAYICTRGSNKTAPLVRGL